MISSIIQTLCILTVCGFVFSVSPPKYKWVILFLFLLLSYLLSTTVDEYCNKVKVHMFSSDIPGPIMVAVAGSHGNEPGGTE